MEFGTGLPRNGGEKNYLEYIYRHPKFLITCTFGTYAALLGWCAGNSLVFGECASSFLPLQLAAGLLSVRQISSLRRVKSQRSGTLEASHSQSSPSLSSCTSPSIPPPTRFIPYTRIPVTQPPSNGVSVSKTSLAHSKSASSSSSPSPASPPSPGASASTRSRITFRTRSRGRGILMRMRS